MSTSAPLASSSPTAAASSASTEPTLGRLRGDNNSKDEHTHSSSSSAQRRAVRRVQLHRHALESIFACLTFSGLASVMIVSRDWQAAVGSMRSIDCEAAVTGGMVTSRLRRHVTAVRLTDGCLATVAVIALLSERMPHLLRLSASDMTIDSGVDSIQWPPLLQHLMLQDIYVPITEANKLLRSIGGLAQLQSLTLSLQYHASLSFAPLSSLTLLRLLTLRWPNSDPPFFSDAQVDDLRALADLEIFDVRMDAESMMRLLRAPHQLRWQRTPFLDVYTLDDAVATVLPTLSCLAELKGHVRCSHFDWLPRMQSLSTFTVGLPIDHPAADAATLSLMSALQQCTRMTSLSVFARNMAVTSEQLVACLSGMPVLSSLHIWHASLSSLAFLAVPSLALSLSDLTLRDFRAPRPDASELRHLHGLRSLRRLTLVDVFATRLDAAARAPFEPPSALLPLLQSFRT